MQITTLGEALSWAEQAFVEADLYFGHGTDNAWDEAVALARYVLQFPPDADASIVERELTADQKKSFIELVNRRIQDRIPVPYLTNEAWFAHQKFYVDERVIIPRSPMGELIINQFQPWLGNRPVKRILDLCTGSGCIAIACAYAFPDAIIDAVDISKEALTISEKNIALHGLQQQINLFYSDLFSGCKNKKYDIIISNPPYVDTRDMQSLPPEFLWEPRPALEAGKDGLQLVKSILKQAPQYLNEQALLFVEVGNSAEALQDQYPNTPFTWIEFEHGGQGVFLIAAEDKACWQTF